MDPEQYCRDLEAFLCRKNDGHLIRIVGPAFDTVRGWAEQGIPFKVACRGVDRYFERYYAKGPRRRPVRIEFCEADVLESFDEWRRAVGVHAVSAAMDGDTAGESAEDRRRRSLPAHLERSVARLTVLRAGGQRGRAFDEACDRIVTELDAAKSGGRALRGETRQALVDRLAALDRDLIETARGELSGEETARVHAEAEAELAPFRGRMAPEAHDAAVGAAVDRLIRERYGLPDLRFQ